MSSAIPEQYHPSISSSEREAKKERSAGQPKSKAKEVNSSAGTTNTPSLPPGI